jgi:hypothetical protein
MSTTAIWPLIDALVAQLAAPVEAALSGATVYDSVPDTDDPGLNYLVIGLPDPNDDGAADSAQSSQAWAYANRPTRDESGTVTCCVVGTDPNGDPSQARANAKAILDAVEDYLRTNYTLAVAQVAWVGFGGDITLQQAYDDTGRVAQVIFTIGFRAQI